MLNECMSIENLGADGHALCTEQVQGVERRMSEATTDPESLEMSRSDTALRKGEPAVLLALAAGCTAVEAADAGGVTARTVFRRLLDAGYRAQLEAHRDAAIARAANRLAAVALDAVETLTELNRHASNDSIRLRAGIAILDHLAPLSAHEVAQHERAVDAVQVVLESDEQTERVIIVQPAPGGYQVLGVMDDAVERLLNPLLGNYEDDIGVALEELSID